MRPFCGIPPTMLAIKMGYEFAGSIALVDIGISHASLSVPTRVSYLTENHIYPKLPANSLVGW